MFGDSELYISVLEFLVDRYNAIVRNTIIPTTATNEISGVNNGANNRNAIRAISNIDVVFIFYMVLTIVRHYLSPGTLDIDVVRASQFRADIWIGYICNCNKRHST